MTLALNTLLFGLCRRSRCLARRALSESLGMRGGGAAPRAARRLRGLDGRLGPCRVGLPFVVLTASSLQAAGLKESSHAAGVMNDAGLEKL